MQWLGSPGGADHRYLLGPAQRRKDKGQGDPDGQVVVVGRGLWICCHIVLMTPVYFSHYIIVNTLIECEDFENPENILFWGP